jgi:hypothetical protein
MLKILLKVMNLRSFQNQFNVSALSLSAICGLRIKLITYRSLHKPAIPGFFQYLPEQTYSFITQNPHLQKLVSNQIYGKLGTRTSKNIMSLQFYPDIEMRPKLHGWESVEKFHDKIRHELALKFPDSNSTSSMEYNALVKSMAKI